MNSEGVIVQVCANKHVGLYTNILISCGNCALVASTSPALMWPIDVAWGESHAIDARRSLRSVNFTASRRNDSRPYVATPLDCVARRCYVLKLNLNLVITLQITSIMTIHTISTSNHAIITYILHLHQK